MESNVRRGKMKNKAVLFLCQYFYPENNSSATLPFDTAKHLAKSGFCVDVICGFPKEYTNQEDVAKKETISGMHISRIHYVQLSRKWKLGRLVNYFSFTIAALFRLFRMRQYRCIVTYSNPPILPIVPILANILFGIKFLFVSYDVYPEIAYASGALTPGCLIDRIMRQLNRVLFKRATMIVALTDEMRDYLLNNRGQLTEDRVVTVPNWAHEEGQQNTSCASFRSEYIEKEPFIVSYIGNMGICQDMDTLANAVECLKDSKSIQFRFVGHGNKVVALKRQLGDYPNVEFYDFLTGAEYQRITAESSCFVVSIERGLRGLCAPSKYYSYMLNRKPIVAIAEENSYLMQEIVKRELGFGITNGDFEQLVQVIKYLMQNPQINHEMGENAFHMYMEVYAKEHAFDAYVQVLRRICCD